MSKQMFLEPPSWPSCPCNAGTPEPTNPRFSNGNIGNLVKGLAVYLKCDDCGREGARLWSPGTAVQFMTAVPETSDAEVMTILESLTGLRVQMANSFAKVAKLTGELFNRLSFRSEPPLVITHWVLARNSSILETCQRNEDLNAKLVDELPEHAPLVGFPEGVVAWEYSYRSGEWYLIDTTMEGDVKDTAKDLKGLSMAAMILHTLEDRGLRMPTQEPDYPFEDGETPTMKGYRDGLTVTAGAHRGMHLLQVEGSLLPVQDLLQALRMNNAAYFVDSDFRGMAENADRVKIYMADYRDYARYADYLRSM